MTNASSTKSCVAISPCFNYTIISEVSNSPNILCINKTIISDLHMQLAAQEVTKDLVVPDLAKLLDHVVLVVYKDSLG